jgi:hypothetical protein
MARSRFLTPLALAALLVLPSAGAKAQTKRALLIGIDRYAYPESLAAWQPRAEQQVSAWRRRVEGASAFKQAGQPSGADEGRTPVSRLDGAVNDAIAMQQILIARFGFPTANVRVLQDAQATRAGILRALQQLADETKPGDLVVVYYAGHGSQRFNSLMRRAGKLNNLEQTLVPADANAGQFDLRSADINPFFNRMLDGGAELTLIFDSCHSGAVTRSPMVPTGVRWAAADPRDALDADDPVPPDSKGALVLAAAQDFQLAKEYRSPEGTPHGAFTYFLLSALRRTPHAPASRIFASVRARLQEHDLSQVPVLRPGKEDRPLFSREAVPDDGRVVVPVQRVDGDTVLLLGGSALEIGPETELRLIDPRQPRDSVRLRIARVTGLGTSRAVAIQGLASSLSAGDLLEVTSWVSPGRPLLRVWLPDRVDNTELTAAARTIAPLRSSTSVEWVNDLTMLPDDGRPLYWVRYSDIAWMIQGPRGETSAVLRRGATARAIEQAIAKLESAAQTARAAAAKAVRDTVATVGAPRVVVLMPLLRSQWREIGLGTPGSRTLAISVAESVVGADYVLAGRLEADGSTSLAWMRPDARQTLEVTSSLPARTSWFGTRGDAASNSAQADSLRRTAIALARIRGWLTLEPPPGSGRSFPFELVIRNRATGEEKRTGLTRRGEVYDLLLRRDSAVTSESIRPHWVYVAGLDSWGGGELLWSSSNRVPPDSAGATMTRAQYALTTPRDTIQVGCPLGVDTFLMVATQEPIDETVFSFSRVQTSATRGNPLVELFRSTSAATRGNETNRAVPSNWSIQRVIVRSVGADGTSDNRQCQ